MKTKITLLLFLFLSSYSVSAQCSGATFEEKNGIAIIEAESGGINASWRRETSKSGYTGSSYITWRGSQYFGAPGNGIISYTVKINSPGKYRFIWRSTISILASHNPATEHNDTWLKIPNASNFYGEKPGSRVYPGGSGKSPVAAGSTTGGWFKIYTSAIPWNWGTFTSDNNAHSIYAEFNSPGVYTIQISARSSGHSIDRMVLYKETSYSASQAQALSRSETRCDGTTTPPITGGSNVNPTVSITNPESGQNFNAGANIPVDLIANDTDGSIVKHEIYVNGAKVDTDGSSYSTYILRSATTGTHTIKARVTDDDGGIGESTVTITVGGGTVTPPIPPTGSNSAPTVSITNPTNGQNFNTGSNIPISLATSDSDGSVVRHEIYVNGTKVDTDGSNYTPHIIRNAQAGSYAIRAKVTDNDGASGEATINFSVGGGIVTPPVTGDNQPPSISITSPVNGNNYSVGSNISVSISGSDSDGSVVKYQIYVNDRLVDTDGAHFTPHIIRNAQAGTYAIKGKVTDNDGAIAETVVNISVGGGTVTPPTNNGALSLTLVNGSTNQDIQAVNNGTGISSGNGINIRANSSFSGTSSVSFDLSGAYKRSWTENYAPYALFGDISGNYYSRNLPNGSYSLTIKAYSGKNKSGTLLGSNTINFTVGMDSDGKSPSYVYPNPVVNGKFSVKPQEGTQGKVRYSLINVGGVEIQSGNLEVKLEGDNISFDMQNFSAAEPGVYYLILNPENNDTEVMSIIKK